MLSPHANYNIVANTVVSGSRTLADLVRFKETNSVYAEVIDKYVPQAWANVLTIADLKRAFNPASRNEYVIGQAIIARAWSMSAKAKAYREQRRRPIDLDNYDMYKAIATVSGVYPTALDLLLMYASEYEIDESYPSLLKELARGFPAGVRMVLLSERVDLSVPGGGDFLIALISSSTLTRLNYVPEEEIVDDVKLAIARGCGELENILSAACRTSLLDVARVLIEAGADPAMEVSMPNRSAMSAFGVLYVEVVHERSRGNDKPTVQQYCDVFRLMFNKGADASEFGSEIAIDDDLSELLALYLEYGADPNSLDHSRGNALFGATVKNMRLLLGVSGIDVDWGDTMGSTPLMSQVGNGEISSRPEGVVLLLEAGANPNVQDDRGRTVLMHVAMALWEATKQEPLLESARALLRAGANTDVVSDTQRTALMIGLLSDKVPVAFIDMLLEAGANVDIQDDRGETALMYALRHGRPGALAILKIANWRLLTNDGQNILFFVMRPEDLDGISNFLGPRITELIEQRDNNGRTPLIWACDRNIDNYTKPHRQASINAIGIIIGLLKLGANPNIADKNGKNAYNGKPWESYKAFINKAISEHGRK